jgi:hypothetical protein
LDTADGGEALEGACRARGNLLLQRVHVGALRILLLLHFLFQFKFPLLSLLFHFPQALVLAQKLSRKE